MQGFFGLCLGVRWSAFNLETSDRLKVLGYQCSEGYVTVHVLGLGFRLGEVGRRCKRVFWIVFGGPVVDVQPGD